MSAPILVTSASTSGQTGPRGATSPRVPARARSKVSTSPSSRSRLSPSPDPSDCCGLLAAVHSRGLIHVHGWGQRRDPLSTIPLTSDGERDEGSGSGNSRDTTLEVTGCGGTEPSGCRADAASAVAMTRMVTD
jgi:hypothetical protein